MLLNYLSVKPGVAQHDPFSYMLGETFSISDAALLPFIRQIAAVDKAWFATAPYPALRAWLERDTSSDLFNLVMRKFPVWEAGREAVVFGREV